MAKVRSRPLAVTAAAIIVGLFGVLGLLTGLGVYLLGVGVAAGQLAWLGGLSLIWGAVDVVAAYGLWHLQKWGGQLTAISAALGAIGGLIFFTADYGFTVVTNGLILLLLKKGWSSLKGKSLSF